MKMTGKELKTALGLAFQVTEERGKPILHQVRLVPLGYGALIEATDLNVSIQIEMVRDGAGCLEGAVMLPAGVKKLLNGNDVEIACEEGKARVKTGRVNALLAGLNPADFPEIPDTSLWGIVGTVDGPALAKRLDVAGIYAAREAIRYALNGVHLDSKGKGLTIVGTDRKRMYIGDALEVEKKVDAIFPQKSADILVKAIEIWGGEVTIRQREDTVAFEVGPAKVVVRKMEGEFPCYAGVVPAGTPTWTAMMSTKDLVQGLKEIQPFLNPVSPCLTLEPAEGAGVKLTAKNEDMGQGEVVLNGTLEGDHAVGINHSFLVDLVKYVEMDEIRLEQMHDAGPVQARGAEGLHVIMPMSIT